MAGIEVGAGRTAVRRRFGGLSALALAAAVAFGAGAADAQRAPAPQAPASQAQPSQPAVARNVIVFLGDAGGVPTLNAAGIYAHDRPLSLFIQSMPHIALSDTSALDGWVSDSAAGMTAIMTGSKTRNGMVSVVPAEGEGGVTPLKTILEYAEERGLSTGVVTNRPIWDATPAACYAHVPSRRQKDEIFRQMLAPRFGDGVDIVIGKGRADAEAAFAPAGLTAAQAFARGGYQFGEDPAAVTPATRRAAILRQDDFAPEPAVDAALASLSRNPRGYFLMVEWDMHTDDPLAGLRHVVEMDDLIRRVSGKVGDDTLILFTADHSFALRMTGGDRSSAFAEQYARAAKPGATPDAHPLMSVLDDHTAEEVLVAASGPGAGQVRGFLPNTRLFEVIMGAFGWRPDR
jgi:alkaline phosphatase